MRQRFFTFVRSLLILATLAGAVVLWMYWQQRNLSLSSSEFALALTESVLSSTSAQPLLDSSHVRLMEGWDAQDLQNYINLIPIRMGELRALVSINGGVETLPVPFLNRPVEAVYQIGADFAEESAICQVGLIYQDGQWLVADFVLDALLMSD